MRSPPPLLFDLDGTLLDTLADIAQSANAARSALGLPAIGHERVRLAVGGGIEEMLRRCLSEGLAATGAETGTVLQRGIAAYRQHHAAHLCDHTRPFPGVTPGLRALHAAGHPMAVVSNKSEAFSRRLLDHFGLTPCLPVVVGGDTCPMMKPRPEPLLHAADALGVAIGDSWMVGDSPGDMEAGQRAGCAQRVAVTWGYRSRELLAGSPCTLTVDSFEQLVSALRSARLSGRP
jgi:phosphoglycolate phosphatase